jgi:hypothetical protein
MYSTRSLFFCELFGCVLCNIIAMILTVTYIVVFLFLFFLGGVVKFLSLLQGTKIHLNPPFDQDRGLCKEGHYVARSIVQRHLSSSTIFSRGGREVAQDCTLTT